MTDTKTTDSKAGAPGGVDVNEEMVATHPGFVAASDEPHPNPYIGGQTHGAQHLAEPHDDPRGLSADGLTLASFTTSPRCSRRSCCPRTT
jgi:hypothetical protein